MTLQDIFRLNLREMRKKAGYTQAELAPLAGVSKVFITELECGSKMPSFQTVETLASIFSVPSWHMLCSSESASLGTHPKDLERFRSILKEEIDKAVDESLSKL